MCMAYMLCVSIQAEDSQGGGGVRGRSGEAFYDGRSDPPMLFLAGASACGNGGRTSAYAWN
jgi:hypothetical protein